MAASNLSTFTRRCLRRSLQSLQLGNLHLIFDGDNSRAQLWLPTSGRQECFIASKVVAWISRQRVKLFRQVGNSWFPSLTAKWIINIFPKFFSHLDYASTIWTMSFRWIFGLYGPALLVAFPMGVHFRLKYWSQCSDTLRKGINFKNLL